VGNRECAFEIFAVASLLEARGANPYRVRAYRRAAPRLLRMSEDAAVYLDERGELDLPGLGQRLRRKLGELVRTGRLSFHDELIAAEPRPIRTLMTVPGIGPKTADRLVGEARVRGLKSLAQAARRGRLQRLRGVGPVRERAWGEAAELLLTPPTATRTGAVPGREAALTGAADHVQAAAQLALFDAIPAEPAITPLDGTEAGLAEPGPAERVGKKTAGPERAA
jgi:DNA polymerase (family 10)